MAYLNEQSQQLEQRFDRLCRAYGSAAAIPAASANFSANMWEAIESRRRSRTFGMVAKLVTSGALAATILLATLPTARTVAVEPEYLAGYIEHSQPPAQAELLASIIDSDGSK
ncbi:MAG: hypothetical protein LC114_25835 [Bryobacterales bacterium]|nr:hypothetical protein [Bryobacterales bacterium]